MGGYRAGIRTPTKGFKGLFLDSGASVARHESCCRLDLGNRRTISRRRFGCTGLVPAHLREMAEIDQPRFVNGAISTSSAGINIEVDPCHPHSKAPVEL